MTTHRPRVTIGLPVYNGEAYLAEAIDSVLAQTYADFEFIISDNASTDGTEDICRSYAKDDRRIEYVRYPENLGAAPNYNKIFERAPGDYFKWIAHDDRIGPDFLRQCIEVIEADPAVVICYSKSVLIDENGGVLEHYSDGLHLRSPEPFERFRQLLETPGWCNPIFGLIRSSVLRTTPLIANYPRSDRNLLAELALHGQFHELSDELIFRRVHPKISTEVHVDEKDLAVWFDARNKGKLLFPRWRRYSDYAAMTLRAPLSVADRGKVLALLSKNIAMPSKLRGLSGDALEALLPRVKLRW